MEENSPIPIEKEGFQAKDISWWFWAIILIFIWAIYIIITRENYQAAFQFIKAGIAITIKTALISYGFALILGLLAGLGRISKNIKQNTK